MPLRVVGQRLSAHRVALDHFRGRETGARFRARRDGRRRREVDREGEARVPDGALGQDAFPADGHRAARRLTLRAEMVPPRTPARHSYDLALSPLPESGRELASACAARCARPRCGGHRHLVRDGRLRDGVVDDVPPRFGRDVGRLHARTLGEPVDLLPARRAGKRAARLRRPGDDRSDCQPEGGRSHRRAHRHAGKRRWRGRARCCHGEPVDPDRRAACRRAHGGRRRLRGHRVRRRRDFRPRQSGNGRDEASLYRLAG